MGWGSRLASMLKVNSPYLNSGFLDFTRCQRADGSHYGTSGQCRKGREVDAKIKELVALMNPKDPQGGSGGHTLERIGRGAYGEAYSIGDGVIIKVGEISEREAMAMEDLKHVEGIPRVVASKFTTRTNRYGDLEDLGIIAMSRAPGKPIASIKSPEAKSKAWEKVLPILKKIHQAGYFHGDLHSGNVMYDRRSQRASVIDFGKAGDTSIAEMFGDLVSVMGEMFELSKAWNRNPEAFPTISAFMRESAKLDAKPHKDKSGIRGKKTLDEFWAAVPDG